MTDKTRPDGKFSDCPLCNGRGVFGDPDHKRGHDHALVGDDANLLRASLAELSLEIPPDNVETHRYIASIINDYDALMSRLGITIYKAEPDDKTPF